MREYHVFVNGDYVGDRLSIAQGDGMASSGKIISRVGNLVDIE